MGSGMIFRLSILTCALLTLVSASHAGSIMGTITYSGEVPKLPPVDLSGDPACAALHGDNPPANEVLVLGEGNTMANVLVRVTKGYAAKEYPAPAEPVTLNQKGCQYSPRVFVLHPAQTLKIQNPDGIMHNVHGMPAVNTPFNRAMPKTLTEIEVQLPKVEDPFEIKCDLHRWMHAYCAVLDHPFYSVTTKDGVFEIGGLEAGEYEIEAWHEKLGKQSATVTVGADAPAKQDFQFTRPAKK